MNLNVADTGALDSLLDFLDNTLDKDNALSSNACCPFHHLLGNFLGGNDKQALNRFGALTQVQEAHLVSLSTRGVHTGTEEDGLPCTARESADLVSRASSTALRLVQRKSAIVLCGKVLEVR